MSGYRTTPRKVEKPWGWELVWAEADDYVGKLLFVRGGESLSLQYHEAKDESWLVQEGRARLELGDVGDELEVLEIAPGDAFRFRPRTVHRVTAIEDTRWSRSRPATRPTSCVWKTDTDAKARQPRRTLTQL